VRVPALRRRYFSRSESRAAGFETDFQQRLASGVSCDPQNTQRRLLHRGNYFFFAPANVFRFALLVFELTFERPPRKSLPGLLSKTHLLLLSLCNFLATDDTDFIRISIRVICG